MKLYETGENAHLEQGHKWWYVHLSCNSRQWYLHSIL